MTGLVIAALVVVGGSMFAANKVHAIAVDCDNNAIIKCGFDSKEKFINIVKSNNSGNGHNDLQAIYNYFGLTASEYNNFLNNAQPGVLYRNGDIKVNGVTVATGAVSVGRIASYHGSGYFSRPIPGGPTLYGNIVDKTFGPNTTQLPIYALLDSYGNLKFAVEMACGNTTWGNNVQTSASCSALNKTPVAGKLNTYNFTASAATTGNATIKSYVYDFGDGSPTVTTHDGNQVVTHAYNHEGAFTATVTVYASVPGNPNLQLPAVSMCAKKIVIELPACVQLEGAILDKSKMLYSFKVTAHTGNGATFTGADFDFGDGKIQTGVLPATPTTATVTHQYAASGKYDALATLHFDMNGAPVTAPTCKAVVTPETVTPECKPGVPVGSAECTPCQYDTSLPSNSPKCAPPTPELPNTGAGNVIAIFATVVIGGFLVYRQLLFRKHRAAFVAAEQGTSPLPLADPLSGDAPLAGTPLATQKRSFLRRRRQF